MFDYKRFFVGLISLIRNEKANQARVYKAVYVTIGGVVLLLVVMALLE